MSPLLNLCFIASMLYLAILATSTCLYAAYLPSTNRGATAGHLTLVASLHAFLWPSATAILSTLGIWYGLLPPSTAAYPIASILTFLPSFKLAVIVAEDLGSSPLARKADRKPPHVQEEAQLPSQPPQPKRVDSWKYNHGGWG